MGVKGLWKALEVELEQLSGDNAGEPGAVARAVDGRCVAVDVSMWMAQATEAGGEGLQAVMPGVSARIAKIMFERVRISQRPRPRRQCSAFLSNYSAHTIYVNFNQKREK
jgi:hypothetical protein